MELHTEV